MGIDMDNGQAIDIGLGSLKIEGDPTKLFEALAKAQAAFEAIPETATGAVGNDRKFKYADFATLTKYTRPHLVANGIALIQPLHYENGMAVTTTILAGHGARISSSFSFSAASRPQDFGAAHTYYRRYQLQGILGLQGEDADSAELWNKERSNGFSESAAPKDPSKPGPQVAVKRVEAQPERKSAPPPKADAAPTKADERPINGKIIDGMRQLGWKMDDLKAFYKEHIDKKGFDKADNLPAPVKQKLYDLMVAKGGVAPY